MKTEEDDERRQFNSYKDKRVLSRMLDESLLRLVKKGILTPGGVAYMIGRKFK